MFMALHSVAMLDFIYIVFVSSVFDMLGRASIALPNPSLIALPNEIKFHMLR